MADSTENFLRHHGVLGMHWGIRKDQSQPSSSDIYNARKRIAKKEIKINALKRVNPKGRGAVYAQSQLKKLKADLRKGADTQLSKKSATKKERATKIQAGAAATALLLSIAGGHIALGAASPKIQAGANLASNILLGGAGVLGISTLVTQASANKDESKFHNR